MPGTDDIRKQFGLRVRQLRLERGWSQEELAARAGVHATYISGVERGRRNPSLIAIGRIAKGFEIAVEKLLTGVDA